MLEIGYYTIGRSKTDKQVYYKILAENVDKGMNLWVQEYTNKLFSNIYQGGYIYVKNELFCVFKNINKNLLIRYLGDCRIALRKKYKSLKWVIDDDVMNDLLVLEAI